MIRCIIVEDEQKSRELLKALLVRYCPNVMVHGEAGNVKEAVQLIKEHKPDLVFLDIEMPDGSGFRLLNEFENQDFAVVFTTAFEQFAIQAIRSEAIDYLLKPIVPEELIAAVEKVKRLKEQRSSQKDFENSISNTDHEAIQPKKIVLATAEKIHVIEHDKIIRCESDNYYTRLYFTDGTMLLVSKTLKEIEHMLQDGDFVRTHKSHLVNIKYIINYDKGKSELILSDKTRVPVSRRKKENILEIINNL
ncbi:MAG: LytTR family DNA-binding domain-containing protein [Lentimicrobiaceae bacterium]|nr:LytTR family DNA-binding domain-containing protein [Lentimicrobiaceae bacterium]